MVTDRRAQAERLFRIDRADFSQHRVMATKNARGARAATALRSASCRHSNANHPAPRADRMNETTMARTGACVERGGSVAPIRAVSPFTMLIRFAPATGITLIELAVVLAIVAVLAVIAAPNLRAFFVDNRLAAAANDFAAALNQARSEAIGRGVPVVMRRCDGAHAETGCAQAAQSRQWSQGWYMFVDDNGDRQRGAGAEALLRVAPPLGGALTLYASAKAADAIAFLPSGRIDAAPNGGGPGLGEAIFVFCHGGRISDGGRSRSRAVVVNRAGGVRLAPTDADGRPLRDSDGAAVASCTEPAY